MAANYGLDTYGNPPYAEAAAKGQARMSALQRIAMLLAGAGQGIQSVRPGVGPFGNALTGFSRSYILSNASKRAAEEYALKQQQAEEASRSRALDDQFTQMKMEQMAKEKPPVPEKVPGKQQDYDHLVNDLGMSPTEARQIVYGLTSSEQTDRTIAGRPAKEVKTPEDTAWIQKYVRTSSGGNQYLDASEFTGEDKSAALRVAAKQGIPVVGSVELGQLQDIEAAKGNIAKILSDLHDLLPADAAARISQYPSIRLSQVLQTSPARAAFNSWRGAAIRNLRAVAGSKGLRLNQKEIDIAVRNDIPQITDTWEVANRKMQTVLDGLDNAERPILRMDLRKPSSAGADSSGADLIYNPSTGQLEPAR